MSYEALVEEEILKGCYTRAARIHCGHEQLWVGLPKHYAAHDARDVEGHMRAAAVHLKAAEWLSRHGKDRPK